jgi:hypothetical protein
MPAIRGPRNRFRCPVCWQRIVYTHRGYVNLHHDSLGRDVCPASFEPFVIAQPYYPQAVYVLRRVNAP